MIENNLQDQDFLDRCCLGFDAEHMPEGADPAGNFKDYVLGTYDGVPKTPEWAFEICGNDVDLIKSFAEEIAATKPMVFQSSLAPCRTHRERQFGQAFPTAGGLYGGYSFSDPFNTDYTGVAYDETWRAILTKKCYATVRREVDCDIRMWFSLAREGDHPNQRSGNVEAVEALRSLECVVACDIVLSNKSKYADIILPGTTTWEEFGFTKMTQDTENILMARGCTEPL